MCAVATCHSFVGISPQRHGGAQRTQRRERLNHEYCPKGARKDAKRKRRARRFLHLFPLFFMLFRMPCGRHSWCIWSPCSLRSFVPSGVKSPSSIHWRAVLGPRLEGFEAGGGAEDEAVLMPATRDLQTDGQAFLREAAGDVCRRVARQVERIHERDTIEDA